MHRLMENTANTIFGSHLFSAEPLEFPRISIDSIVTSKQNGAEIKKATSKFGIDTEI